MSAPAPAPAPAAEFLELQEAVAGRFSLDRELGRGGMGIVFLARDVALDRLVAIKLLPRHLAHDQIYRERFIREARTAARLAHPHIVPIHQVEEHGHLVFFVMGFVDGTSLGERVRREGPLTPKAARRLVQEVAWALGYAHQHGIVHRDIKPDNILIERGSGRSLVTDFGIARAAEGETLSARGEIVGTAHFMSPEQATGEAVDGRSDIYALGVTGFYALTGRLPFTGANVPALIHQHVSVPAPRVAAQGLEIPARLAEAVDRCLAKDPGKRWPSGEALADALTESGSAARDVPPQIRSLLRLVSQGTAVVAVLGTLLFWLLFVGANVWDAIMALQRGNLVMIGGFIALTAVTYGRELLQATRRVLQSGYDAEHVRQTLVFEGEAILEEAQLKGNRVAQQKNAREVLIRWSPAAVAVGTILLWLGLAGDFIAETTVTGVAAILGGILGFLAGPSVERESPIRAIGFVERMLLGRFGRLLFRLAGRGQKPPSPGADAGRPTEVVLATQLDGLFDALPPSLRQQFAAVPDVIRRLEAHAAALRRRAAALSAQMARGTPNAVRDGIGVEKLEAARVAVQSRLETTVAALENLRLGLLRLRAGVGSPDDLTAELQRAREIGDAIDRELAARSEVESVLRQSITPA